jgi:DNA-binding winged helix-turn-helix (wHTH) protein
VSELHDGQVVRGLSPGDSQALLYSPQPVGHREAFHFGEFTLDVHERRFQRGADAVRLAPKAFDVLVEMLRHPGRLVSKDELLARVWPDSFVEEGILAVHVSALRRALRDDTWPSTYIETVARSGYRFVAPVRRVDGPDDDSPALSPVVLTGARLLRPGRTANRAAPRGVCGG